MVNGSLNKLWFDVGEFLLLKGMTLAVS